MTTAEGRHLKCKLAAAKGHNLVIGAFGRAWREGAGRWSSKLRRTIMGL